MLEEPLQERFADDRDRVSVEQFDFFGDWNSLLEVDDEYIVFTKEALVTLPETRPVVDRLERFAKDG
ncbi:hypothetical protein CHINAEXTREME_19470 [Halobiforma lacisalsi AJ5]|uniref:Uncharacterized protein n=1 Tax=Natronobacterium lacisalsi AJ5 TaxID=358396 RepID=M0LSC0_NATLA|nr:hypothetical protein [Halobiforma lacisalsi]APW99817.1 hypothetical protein CHINAEXTREME_19470 [Halobiforma lacisalsi AJ5]EMA36003.1 hypothetical protein C445_04078 [Halobiforma lacisalsi AJ5]